MPPGSVLTKPPELGPVQQRQADIDKGQIDDDRKYVADLNDQRTASLQSQQQILNTKEIAKGLHTGSYAEAEKGLENFMASYGPDWANRFIKAVSGIDVTNDAGKWQELSKLTLQMAGQAEQSVAGSHGGFNLVRLYQHSFPGLETQPGAFDEMMNLFLVQHQFNIDHAQAANSYYGPAQQANKADPVAHPYSPVSQAVDEPFLAQSSTHSPQVYVAATALLNNHPRDEVFKGLTQAQQVEAVQIARRSNTNMTYNPNAKVAQSAP